MLGAVQTNKVFCLAAVFAMVMSAGCSSSTSDQRWSAFPHTMGCVMDSGQDYGGVDPPASLWAERVTMTHPGGNWVGLSIEFARPPRPTVGKVVSPFTGQVVNAPGSLIYMINIGPKDAGEQLVLGPSDDGKGWDATTLSGKLPVDPPHPDNAALLSVETPGNVLTFQLDLEEQVKSWGSGPFTPQVQVSGTQQGQLGPDLNLVIFKTQTCSWDTSVSAESPASTSVVAAPAQPSAADPAPANTNSAPPPAAMPPSTGNVLSPNANGNVFVQTQRGKTLCVIWSAEVDCRAHFTHSPGQANVISLTRDGVSNWRTNRTDPLPSVQFTTLEHDQIYHAVDWSIYASADGTRFTNDSTGHSTFVSIDNVYSF